MPGDEGNAADKVSDDTVVCGVAAASGVDVVREKNVCSGKDCCCSWSASPAVDRWGDEKAELRPGDAMLSSFVMVAIGAVIALWFD